MQSCSSAAAACARVQVHGCFTTSILHLCDINMTTYNTCGQYLQVNHKSVVSKQVDHKSSVVGHILISKIVFSEELHQKSSYLCRYHHCFSRLGAL